MSGEYTKKAERGEILSVLASLVHEPDELFHEKIECPAVSTMDRISIVSLPGSGVTGTDTRFHP
jgi:hypothetical protein